ncbi:hypothetical protein H4582DRAFT_1916648 [Lactarius indigo]|nr:hypothetical protein H4582DRAFT_1916648 [Lactarius indigo]
MGGDPIIHENIRAISGLRRTVATFVTRAPNRGRRGVTGAKFAQTPSSTLTSTAQTSYSPPRLSPGPPPAPLGLPVKWKPPRGTQIPNPSTDDPVGRGGGLKLPNRKTLLRRAVERRSLRVTYKILCWYFRNNFAKFSPTHYRRRFYFFLDFAHLLRKT